MHTGSQTLREQGFFVQDRFAEKYMSMTLYQYGGNNPILFIDVNGDSLNVGHLRDNNAKANEALMSDLQEKTGLTLNTDKDGNVTYAKDDDGKAIVSTNKNGKMVGSRTARKALMKLINSKKSTVSVKYAPDAGRGPGTRVDRINDKYTNTIFIDDKQINYFISNTSSDLNSTTFGYALNFFHELGHTIYGGGNDDPGNPSEVSGANEILPNKIRRELGPSYGQRLTYAQVVVPSTNKTYLPFGYKALEALKNGQTPNSQYIFLEDFNKRKK